MFIKTQQRLFSADAPEGAVGGLQTGDPNQPNTLPTGPADPAQEPGQEPESEPDAATDNPEPPAGDVPDDTDFLRQINQLHGREITVDYGDVEPLSPQGIYLREQTLIADARDSFERELEQRYPSAYRYMLHQQMGRPDEEFFATRYLSLPDAEILKGDVSLQRNLVRSDLIQKGVQEAYVDAIVAKMETDGKLQQESLTVHQQRQAAEVKALEQEKQEALRQQAELEAKVTQFNSRMVDALDKELKLVVPDAKRSDFTRFVAENLRTDANNEFVMTLPLKDDKFIRIMQAAYLVYSNGDLKESIRKAGSATVTSVLRQKVANSAQISGQQSSAPKEGGKRLTDLW